MQKTDRNRGNGRSRAHDRRPIELTPAEFWEKWRPKAVTATIKADFMVDLERVMLTRMRDLGLLEDRD